MCPSHGAPLPALGGQLLVELLQPLASKVEPGTRLRDVVEVIEAQLREGRANQVVPLPTGVGAGRACHAPVLGASLAAAHGIDHRGDPGVLSPLLEMDLEHVSLACHVLLLPSHGVHDAQTAPSRPGAKGPPRQADSRWQGLAVAPFCPYLRKVIVEIAGHAAGVRRAVETVARALEAPRDGGVPDVR